MQWKLDQVLLKHDFQALFLAAGLWTFATQLVLQQNDTKTIKIVHKLYVSN